MDQLLNCELQTDSGGCLTQNSVDSEGGVLFNGGEHHWGSF